MLVMFYDQYGRQHSEDCVDIHSVMLYSEYFRANARWAMNTEYSNADWNYRQNLRRLAIYASNRPARWSRPTFRLHPAHLQLDIRKIKEMNNTLEPNSEPIVHDCDGCSARVEITRNNFVDDGFYCDSCITVCNDCEERHALEHCRYDSVTTVCESCYENDWGFCEDCDDLVQNDNLNTVHGGSHCVCESCLHRNYHFCEEYDEYHHDGCDCDGCIGETSSRHIHSYGYEPDTIFYDDREYPSPRPKRGEIYFGCEIEMNTADYENTVVNNASEYVVTNISSDLVYLKEDSSIGTGFEFVTHPLTLDYWRNQFPWNNYEHLASMGMRAWDSVGRRCGLHINISKTAFSKSSHLSKFILFVYRNEEEMVKFAGRRSRDYADFSLSERQLFVQHGKGDTYGARHVALNFQNRDRIEFRIFRPSLKRDTVISSIELCHALIHYTSNLSCQDIYNDGLSFQSFRNWLTAGDTPTSYDRLVARIDKRVYKVSDDVPSLESL